MSPATVSMSVPLLALAAGFFTTGGATFSNQLHRAACPGSRDITRGTACLLSCAVSERLCHSCCRKTYPNNVEGASTESSDGSSAMTTGEPGSGATDEDSILAAQENNRRRASECLAACTPYTAAQVRKAMTGDGDSSPSVDEIAEALGKVARDAEYWKTVVGSGRPGSILTACRNDLALC